MRTSIHVVVDGNGQPKALGLTLDQTANFTVTEAMLNVLEAGSQLIAGKAYDTNAILDHPTAVGATPVVPLQEQRHGARDARLRVVLDAQSDRAVLPV